MAEPIAPDLLAHGLKLVFCGTAMGRKSAQQKAYYANPGNRFWPTLHAVGFTPKQFTPHQYPELLPLGIGLTDLCKTASGCDHELAPNVFDPDALREKILRYQPRILAFTSKNAAALFSGEKVQKIALGLQPQRIGDTRLFALSSTSGANGHWNEQRYIWQELAAMVRAL